MSQQLNSLRQENQSLKAELKVLREKHEYTVFQLADAKESQEKLKKLNDSLMKTIEANTVNFEPLRNINLVLEGEFTSKKIAELERELDKYRNGVNNSVDRRVRDIIQGYTQMQEDDKEKRQVSSNVNINYNLVQQQKSAEQCQTCAYLKSLLEEKEALIAELNIQTDELRADTSILSSKLSKLQALADTLKKENKLLEGQKSRLQLELNRVIEQENAQHPYQYERDDKSHSRMSFPRVVPPEKENMMREISNIANFLSSRKQQEERGKSRMVPIRDSTALFSIKNGINRPNQMFF